MPLIDLYAELRGHGVVKTEVDRQQRLVRRGICFHRERHGYGHHEIVLVVVDEYLVAQEATLASLHNDDDAGLVEHWRAAQRSIGAEKAHIRQRGQRVSLLGCEFPE